MEEIQTIGPFAFADFAFGQNRNVQIKKETRKRIRIVSHAFTLLVFHLLSYYFINLLISFVVLLYLTGFYRNVTIYAIVLWLLISKFATFRMGWDGQCFGDLMWIYFELETLIKFPTSFWVSAIYLMQYNRTEEMPSSIKCIERTSCFSEFRDFLTFTSTTDMD